MRSRRRATSASSIRSRAHSRHSAELGAHAREEVLHRLGVGVQRIGRQLVEHAL
jgi:hypothetical protein